ncbi:MAG: aldehyde dehydrogenase [Bacteroidota bacterium]
MSTQTSPTQPTSQATGVQDMEVYIRDLISKQSAFYYSGQTRNVDWRIKQLKTLRKGIKEHEQQIFDALKSDLGKSEFDTYATEVGFVLEELKHTIANVRSWAQPTPVGTPLTQAISTARTEKEPWGRALIIAPWNYPFQLTISPLIGAMAAGNTAIVKPSEYTPATNKLIVKLIESLFPKEYIAVVEGAVPETQILLEQKHDFIFFTGSPNVGKIVMHAAADHLTPVVLELGGKSPCLVDKSVKTKTAASRIVWGKYTNCGQTCVAPDYLLVHKDVKDKLLQQLKSTIQDFYGNDAAQSPDYGRIINRKHFDRLSKYIEQGTVYHGGNTDAEKLYIEPTILTDVDPRSEIMQEEIFGPILPIIEYDNLDHALELIREKDNPLAAYVFTTRSSVEKRFVNEVDAGGMCINDTLVHLAPAELPFGGKGHSGIGRYHGQHSFDAFSHHKGVMKKSNLIDPDLRYPPHKPMDMKVVKFMMG